MPELFTTLKALYERENRHNKFMASLQGIDLGKEEGNSDSEKVTTHEEIYARVARRLGANENDAGAIEHGIPLDMGMDYEVYRA